MVKINVNGNHQNKAAQYFYSSSSSSSLLPSGAHKENYNTDQTSSNNGKPIYVGCLSIFIKYNVFFFYVWMLLVKVKKKNFLY